MVEVCQWHKLSGEACLPEEKVLYTDKQGTMVFGLVDEDSESSTGYIAYDYDMNEIEAIAYQSVDSYRWQSPQQFVGKDNIVCRTEGGHCVVGKVYCVDSEYFCENAGAYIGNIIGCYQPKPYKAKQKIISFKRSKIGIGHIASFVAAMLICVLLEHIGIFQEENDALALEAQKYDAIMYSLLTKEHNRSKTEEMLSSHGMDSVNRCRVTLKDDVMEMEFVPQNFFVDVDDNWHYQLEDGRELIITAYTNNDSSACYVADPTTQRYDKFNRYYIEFYEVAQQSETFNSTSADAQDVQHTKADIIQFFNRELDSCSLIVSTDGEIETIPFDIDQMWYDAGGNWHYRSDEKEYYVHDNELAIFSENQDTVRPYTFCIELRSENYYKLLFCSLST